MSLAVRRASFTNFRNYREFCLDDIGMLIVLVGPNAVGKTNIVEGLQLLTGLYSFRHPTVEQLLLNGEGEARLEADITDGNRLLKVDLTLRDHVKKYALNGKAKKAQELKGLMPAVSFTPDDLNLVKGSMGDRRSALDALGSQLSPNHYLIRKDYEKVVKYKNRLLKEEASRDLIASIDEMLVTCGAQLLCYRIALLKKLVPALIGHYASISSGSEKLTVRYTPSWVKDDNSSSIPGFSPVEENALNLVFDSNDIGSFHIERDVARETLAAALENRRPEELARRKAVIGPHADKLDFLLDGRNATHFGSQGQQRSIVLAFKLAEATVIEEVLNQKPIMLLDDVMSELDEMRREALVEFVVKDVQTFITTANLQYFEKGILEKANVVHLSHKEGALS